MRGVVWSVLILGCLAFWAAVGALWYEWRFAEYEARLAECRGEAADANELTTQILNRTRFVRQYDAKTGHSVYVAKVRR